MNRLGPMIASEFIRWAALPSLNFLRQRPSYNSIHNASEVCATNGGARVLRRVAVRKLRNLPYRGPEGSEIATNKPYSCPCRVQGAISVQRVG